MKENKILQISFEFALAVIAYCELLEVNKKFVLARQLLKSGTSVGANIREAQNSESNADFIHKFKIAAKDADDTEYWLELCSKSESYQEPGELMNQIISIKKLLNAIITTMKNKNKFKS